MGKPPKKREASPEADSDDDEPLVQRAKRPRSTPQEANSAADSSDAPNCFVDLSPAQETSRSRDRPRNDPITFVDGADEDEVVPQSVFTMKKKSKSRASTAPPPSASPAVATPAAASGRRRAPARSTPQPPAPGSDGRRAVNSAAPAAASPASAAPFPEFNFGEEFEDSFNAAPSDLGPSSSMPPPPLPPPPTPSPAVATPTAATSLPQAAAVFAQQLPPPGSDGRRVENAAAAAAASPASEFPDLDFADLLDSNSFYAAASADPELSSSALPPSAFGSVQPLPSLPPVDTASTGTNPLLGAPVDAAAPSQGADAGQRSSELASGGAGMAMVLHAPAAPRPAVEQVAGMSRDGHQPGPEFSGLLDAINRQLSEQREFMQKALAEHRKDVATDLAQHWSNVAADTQKALDEHRRLALPVVIKELITETVLPNTLQPAIDKFLETSKEQHNKILDEAGKRYKNLAQKLHDHVEHVIDEERLTKLVDSIAKSAANDALATLPTVEAAVAEEFVKAVPRILAAIEETDSEAAKAPPGPEQVPVGRERGTKATAGKEAGEQVPPKSTGKRRPRVKQHPQKEPPALPQDDKGGKEEENDEGDEQPENEDGEGEDAASSEEDTAASDRTAAHEAFEKQSDLRKRLEKHPYILLTALESNPNHLSVKFQPATPNRELGTDKAPVAVIGVTLAASKQCPKHIVAPSGYEVLAEDPKSQQKLPSYEQVRPKASFGKAAQARTVVQQFVYQAPGPNGSRITGQWILCAFDYVKHRSKEGLLPAVHVFSKIWTDAGFPLCVPFVAKLTDEGPDVGDFLFVTGFLVQMPTHKTKSSMKNATAHTKWLQANYSSSIQVEGHHVVAVTPRDGSPRVAMMEVDDTDVRRFNITRIEAVVAATEIKVDRARGTAAVQPFPSYMAGVVVPFRYEEEGGSSKKDKKKKLLPLPDESSSFLYNWQPTVLKQLLRGHAKLWDAIRRPLEDLTQESEGEDAPNVDDPARVAPPTPQPAADQVPPDAPSANASATPSPAGPLQTRPWSRYDGWHSQAPNGTGPPFHLRLADGQSFPYVTLSQATAFVIRNAPGDIMAPVRRQYGGNEAPAVEEIKAIARYVANFTWRSLVLNTDSPIRMWAECVPDVRAARLLEIHKLLDKFQNEISVYNAGRMIREPKKFFLDLNGMILALFKRRILFVIYECGRHVHGTANIDIRDLGCPVNPRWAVLPPAGWEYADDDGRPDGLHDSCTAALLLEDVLQEGRTADTAAKHSGTKGRPTASKRLSFPDPPQTAATHGPAASTPVESSSEPPARRLALPALPSPVPASANAAAIAGTNARDPHTPGFDTNVPSFDVGGGYDGSVDAEDLEEEQPAERRRSSGDNGALDEFVLEGEPEESARLEGSSRTRRGRTRRRRGSLQIDEEEEFVREGEPDESSTRRGRTRRRRGSLQIEEEVTEQHVFDIRHPSPELAGPNDLSVGDLPALQDTKGPWPFWSPADGGLPSINYYKEQVPSLSLDAMEVISDFDGFQVRTTLKDASAIKFHSQFNLFTMQKGLPYDAEKLASPLQNASSHGVHGLDGACVLPFGQFSNKVHVFLVWQRPEAAGVRPPPAEPEFVWADDDDPSGGNSHLQEDETESAEANANDWPSVPRQPSRRRTTKFERRVLVLSRQQGFEDMRKFLNTLLGHPALRIIDRQRVAGAGSEYATQPRVSVELGTDTTAALFGLLDQAWNEQRASFTGTLTSTIKPLVVAVREGTQSKDRCKLPNMFQLQSGIDLGRDLDLTRIDDLNVAFGMALVTPGVNANFTTVFGKLVGARPEIFSVWGSGTMAGFKLRELAEFLSDIIELAAAAGLLHVDLTNCKGYNENVYKSKHQHGNNFPFADSPFLLFASAEYVLHQRFDVAFNGKVAKNLDEEKRLALLESLFEQVRLIKAVGGALRIEVMVHLKPREDVALLSGTSPLAPPQETVWQEAASCKYVDLVLESVLRPMQRRFMELVLACVVVPEAVLARNTFQDKLFSILQQERSDGQTIQAWQAPVEEETGVQPPPIVFHSNDFVAMLMKFLIGGLRDALDMLGKCVGVNPGHRGVPPVWEFLMALERLIPYLTKGSFRALPSLAGQIAIPDAVQKFNLPYCNLNGIIKMKRLEDGNMVMNFEFSVLVTLVARRRQIKARQESHDPSVSVAVKTAKPDPSAFGLQWTYQRLLVQTLPPKHAHVAARLLQLQSSMWSPMQSVIRDLQQISPEPGTFNVEQLRPALAKVARALVGFLDLDQADRLMQDGKFLDAFLGPLKSQHPQSPEALRQMLLERWAPDRVGADWWWSSGPSVKLELQNIFGKDFNEAPTSTAAFIDAVFLFRDSAPNRFDTAFVHTWPGHYAMLVLVSLLTDIVVLNRPGDAHVRGPDDTRLELSMLRWTEPQRCFATEEDLVRNVKEVLGDLFHEALDASRADLIMAFNSTSKKLMGNLKHNCSRWLRLKDLAVRRSGGAAPATRFIRLNELLRDPHFMRKSSLADHRKFKTVSLASVAHAKPLSVVLRSPCGVKQQPLPGGMSPGAQLAIDAGESNSSHDLISVEFEDAKQQEFFKETIRWCNILGGSNDSAVAVVQLDAMRYHQVAVASSFCVIDRDCATLRPGGYKHGVDSGRTISKHTDCAARIAGLFLAYMDPNCNKDKLDKYRGRPPNGPTNWPPVIRDLEAIHKPDHLWDRNILNCLIDTTTSRVSHERRGDVTFFTGDEADRRLKAALPIE